MASFDELLRTITHDYLKTIDRDNPPTPDVIQSQLLDSITLGMQAMNANRATGDKWKNPHKLGPAQIADVLNYLYDIKNIACAGMNADSEYDMLAIYMKDGPDEGIYVLDRASFARLIKQYSYTMSTRDINETEKQLQFLVERVERNDDKHLVAVNNGIFNYDTKELMPFTPDLVFTSKSRVDYNPNATNVTIHNNDDGTDWDVESWMLDLFDGNKRLSELMWQMVGAIIRPNVSWNKSAWFYSERGNNGKGTICEFMRQISGAGTCATIPLVNFSKEFMLEPLIRASCVIADENDVGTYVDKAANLKAVITGDSISINRKGKPPIAYQFKGFMVQCLNEMPKIKDKSESFYRRQLFVPFNKCFTGSERKYIKDEYLKRQDVLEYALKRVLESNYYELDEPDECKLVLEEYKQYNDPVREFLLVFMSEFKWSLLPYSFLYDLYKAWYKDSYGGERMAKSQSKFTREVKQLIIDEYPDWEVSNHPVKTSTRMNDAEPLIAEYDLTKWKNKDYRGDRIDKICHPMLRESYRGIIRK